MIKKWQNEQKMKQVNKKGGKMSKKYNKKYMYQVFFFKY